MTMMTIVHHKPVIQLGMYLIKISFLKYIELEIVNLSTFYYLRVTISGPVHLNRTNSFQ